MADRPLTDWNTDLCDCCGDASTCCYGFWCCPCMACSVSSQFGQNQCLPLCDIFTPSVLVACGIPLVVPPAALSLRAAIRNRYNIQGSLCKDIAVSCFCCICSWCQMHRELKLRQRIPAVITIHSPNLVNTQPGQMHRELKEHERNLVDTQPGSSAASNCENCCLCVCVGLGACLGACLGLMREIDWD